MVNALTLAAVILTYRRPVRIAVKYPALIQLSTVAMLTLNIVATSSRVKYCCSVPSAAFWRFWSESISQAADKSGKYGCKIAVAAVMIAGGICFVFMLFSSCYVLGCIELNAG